MTIVRALLIMLFTFVGSANVFGQSASEADRLLKDIEAFSAASRHTEAMQVAERYLAMTEGNPSGVGVGLALARRRVAAVYWNVGRYDQAKQLHELSLQALRAALDPRHAEIAAGLTYLGDVHREQGQLAMAEPLYRQALQIMTNAVGTSDMAAGTIHNSYGRLLRLQERYDEAERLYTEGLVAQEAAFGPDSAAAGETLNNLGVIYYFQRRWGDAENYFKRSLAIREEKLSPDHVEVGRVLNNLAALYRELERYADAEVIIRRSIRIREQSLSPAHGEVGQGYSNLGLNLRTQRKFDEAEQAYLKAISIRRQARGATHPEVAETLHNLAAMYRELRRFDEADRLFDEAIAINSAAFGADHASLAGNWIQKARGAVDQQQWATAATLMRKNATIHMSTTRRESAAQRLPSDNALKLRLSELTYLVKILWRAAAADPARLDALSAEAFIAAQWGLSSKAGAAMAQMAARLAKSDSSFADLMRERQDLARHRQDEDVTLIRLVSRPASERNLDDERRLRASISARDAAVAALDERIMQEQPNAAALATVQALAAQDVPAHLGPTEALILYLDTPERDGMAAETFIWVITDQRIRWYKADLGTKQLETEVARLRRGLDPSSGSLRAVLPLAPTATAPQLFDTLVAHSLYQALLAPMTADLDGKSHIMVVASGPLTAMPFNVLLRRPLTDASELRRADWLILHHAITVLPTVASLAALRPRGKTAVRVAARHSYLGIADPRFSQAVQPLPSGQTPKRDAGLSDYFRAGAVNAHALELLAPLPDSADEVGTIAARLQNGAQIRVGPLASETEVKRLPLDQFRIVHFATHGLVAGELRGLAEPALALSRPLEPTSIDDGLLTASEITALKLNADWVILSACNTAAGEAPGAEALSGLARAFFYAGAQTLLVSHWPVRSSAAVRLTTSTLALMSDVTAIGRSEALRRAMLDMIQNGDAVAAHPSSWAPFFVVGEGARN